LARIVVHRLAPVLLVACLADLAPRRAAVHARARAWVRGDHQVPVPVAGHGPEPVPVGRHGAEPVPVGRRRPEPTPVAGRRPEPAPVGVPGSVRAALALGRAKGAVPRSAAAP